MKSPTLSSVVTRGVYLLIFLLPWQARWFASYGELVGGYYEYATISFYAVDVLLILLIAGALQLGYWKKVNLSRPVWWLIAGMELGILLAIVTAPNRLLAFFGYWQFLLGVGIFFLLVTVPLDRIKFYTSIVATGVVQSLLAGWQFAQQYVFSSVLLGMAAQNPGSLGVSVVETADRRWLRAYGSLPHPNMLGGLLVISLLVSIVLYYKFWCQLEHSEDEAVIRRCRWGMLASLVSFAVITASLLVTFSRSAWLAAMLGIVLLIPLMIHKYRLAGLMVLAKFIILFIAIAGIFSYVYWEPVATRVTHTARLEEQSITNRMSANTDARQLIAQHWLLGVGARNYGLAMQRDVDNARVVFGYEPVHNVWLLVWSEAGIIGLFAFVSLLIYSIITLFQRRSYGTVAIVTALIPLLLLDHWLWSLHFGMLLFWLVLGLAYIKQST